MDPNLFVTALEGSPRTEGLNGEQIVTLNELNFRQAEKACLSCPVLFDCSSSATRDDFAYTFRAGTRPAESTARKRGRPKIAEQPGDECPRGHGPMSKQADRGRKVGYRLICRECINLRRRGHIAKQTTTTDTSLPCIKCGEKDWRQDKRSDGYIRNVCRTCHNAYHKARRAAKLSG